MATQIKSKPGLVGAYNDCSKQVREYFEHIPKLLDQFPMDVCLAYVFARLELGQNMALYCGVVKLHKANSEVAYNAVGTHHMTREGFASLFKTVFDFDLSASVGTDLEAAEETRDKVMHGKPTTDDRLRNAIARVLDYAQAVNAALGTRCRFKPFANLRGFAGKTKKLDKRTTRFMLKGMGFGIA